MEAQLTQRALPVLGLPAMAVATGAVGKIPKEIPFECNECFQAIFCKQCISDKDKNLPCPFKQGRKTCAIKDFKVDHIDS